MRIWHEKLIPHLCQKHLCACWREALGAYKIITENKKGYRNHPATKEFENGVLSLYTRLNCIREEMIRRGYNPKELPNKPADIHIDYTTPWQTLKEQIKVLKSKGCKCNI